MANRYSQISTSQFNPLSLQEVLTVPLYKQKLYDQLEADRVATQEAFKVDPRDPFVNKAKQLQADFNAKADELARYQLKTGDLQGARSKMLDLRKEYKRLTDPMGEVAQINAEKANVAAQQEQYIKGATAMKYSPEAVQRNFKEQLAKHDSGSLYSDKGMINQFTANLPSNREDAIEEAKILFDKTGLSSTEIENTIDSFQHDVNTGTDFTRAVTNATSSIKNIDQRNAVVNFLQNRLLNQNSDMYKTEKYEGRNINDTLKAIRDLSPIYAKNTYGRKHSENLGNIQRPDKIKDPDGVNYPDSIPEKVIPLNNNEDLLKKLENHKPNTKIFVKGNATALSIKGIGPYKTSTIKTSENLLNEDPEYVDIAQKIINKNPSLKGLKTNNQKVVTATIEYLRKHQNTQTVNRIITPTTNKDLRGYSPDEIAKYTKMKEDAMRTSIMNGMKVYDEKGNQIKNPVSNNIVYNGEYTFNSIVPIKSTNPKAKYAPIAATLLEKNSDGVVEERRVYVEQNPDREKEPLFNAQYLAKKALEKANKFRNLPSDLKNTFTEENLGLRDVKITYNDDDSIILEGKHFEKGKWINTPPQTYANDTEFINSIYNLHK